MIDHQIALEQQKKSQAREAKEKLVKEYGDSDDDEVLSELLCRIITEFFLINLILG